RPTLVVRLPGAAVLVRAHVPETRRAAVRWTAGARRGRGLLRSRGVPSLAAHRAGAQGAAPAAPRLSAVARFSLRVRARPAGDRSDYRQAAAAGLGGRAGPPP